MVIIDTNIVIELYKGNFEIGEKCSQLGKIGDLYISDITVGEFFAGTLDKQEFHKIKKHLSYFPVLHINESISKTMALLIEQYCLSHHPHVGDMLIAATALHYNIPVYTLNLKDFRHIPDLKLIF